MPFRSANLPDHVDKGLMSSILRRAPKEAGPTVRHGVTRASTVGVEYEHKGIKGWGRDVEAARASWQQNASMAKRDVGKSDSWEVPMGHYEPALPRRRPNYGAGNTVGKRMTGAVTGVAKPKKVQPTRVAARRASSVKIPSMQAMTQPPIPPNMVGKRDRNYNPEANRQRRLGGAVAATAIGGGGAIASGVREARRDTGTLRGIDPGVVHVPAEPSKPRKQVRGDGGRMRSLTSAEHESEEKAYNERLGHRSRRLATREGLERARAAGEKGTVITRRSGGRLALGTVLLGASAGMGRYSRSRSNREHR